MTILFVPVQFNGNSSGSRSARMCYKYLLKNNEVFVYSFGDINKPINISETHFIKRTPFLFKHNFFSANIKEEFNLIVDNLKPDCVFIFGNLWLFPNYYYEILLKKNIKIIQMILRQEFHCYHSHAVIDKKGNLLNSNIFYNYDLKKYDFSVKNLVKALFFKFQKRKKLNYLTKVDTLIGSSNDRSYQISLSS